MAEQNPSNTSSRESHVSDTGEMMRSRNVRRKDNPNKAILGNIKFYVNSEDKKAEMFTKLEKAKSVLRGKLSHVTNAEILHEALDLYLRTYHDDHSDHTDFQQYLYCSRDRTNEEIFLTTQSAIRNMSAGIHQHSQICRKNIDVKDIRRSGHAGKVTFMCEDKHTFKCDTSPHIEGGKYYVNLRMMHAVFGSGLRFTQYERACNSANIGVCPESFFGNVHDIYCDVTSDVTSSCIRDAINDEVAHTILQCDEEMEEFKGINILSDARHGWRKNAAQSDVIALGSATHKVVGAVTVTRDDDPVSQRHELIGAKQIYNHFEEEGVNVNIHGHDRNSSINKYLDTEQPTVTNANDTWHATKGIAKVLKAVSSGPKKMHAVTWHSELSDKAGSIKTHCYYAMKNCGKSSQKLKQLLENIVEHYKNNHENCFENSRCRTDDNYIPSKTILKDSDAERILLNAIRGLQIYKNAGDYIYCMDTHYVESFNNASLTYHDKRIAFGHKEYQRRTNMAILDWNHNVDREYTSISYFEDARHPRKHAGHKNLSPKSFSFLDTIWEHVIENYYHT